MVKNLDAEETNYLITVQEEADTAWADAKYINIPLTDNGMSSQFSDTQRLDLLLDGSKSFDELAADCNDEVDCYKSLREAAKQHLRSFDEYLRFYEICSEEGPTGFVYSQLFRNAERSLKNMVICGSDAGQRYPINSLVELDTRVKKYRDLGLDEITTEGVVSTVLEHLYENESDIVYEVCDNLLAESEPSTAGAKLLTHARFTSVATSLGRDTEAFELPCFAAE